MTSLHTLTLDDNQFSGNIPSELAALMFVAGRTRAELKFAHWQHSVGTGRADIALYSLSELQPAQRHHSVGAGLPVSGALGPSVRELGPVRSPRSNWSNALHLLARYESVSGN
jgi:hypothetical protein